MTCTRFWLPAVVGAATLISCQGPARLRQAAAPRPVVHAAEGCAMDTTAQHWIWRPIWSRPGGSATIGPDREVHHSAPTSTRIEQAVNGEFSFQLDLQSDGRPLDVTVREGDLVDVTAWVKVQGKGQVAISVVRADRYELAPEGVWGADLATLHGAAATCATEDWAQLRARIAVPAGVQRLVPRLTGKGPVTVWTEGFEVTRKGNIREITSKVPPEPLVMENPLLSVSVDPRSGTVSVLDRRTSYTWRQQPLGNDVVVLSAASPSRQSAELTLLYVPLDLKLKATVELDTSLAEVLVRLDATGPVRQSMAFPHPFTPTKGMRLIVPLGEGIDYPVDDETITPIRLASYAGWGLSMAFWGIADSQQSVIAIIETPDDAAVHINRAAPGAMLHATPEWDGQKGQFGYERRLRYVFLDQGGHVGIAKRYRIYARQIGLLKTLTEKRRENPNVDRLIGSVNVWCRERGTDALAMVKSMQAAGIKRILWSQQASPEAVTAMNKLGILTSRYDIYQDVRDPERAARRNSPLFARAWPVDLIVDEGGRLIPGWEDRMRDGTMVPCGVMCDKQALSYADTNIAEDLRTRPFLSRFLDATTCTAWRECYSPDHPMTRTDSRQHRIQLLDMISGKYKLVCGSENGIDAAVPSTHYFEGILSMGPYRVPDCGRNIQEIWHEVPELLSKFQVGHKYRLPLWELVYHDCVVSTWYWGDHNNKLPDVWEKRDLLNALYGTSPMFIFNQTFWDSNKDRFVRSYRTASPIARATGYSEMTDHRFITADRLVQQTVFANGVTVTVNFGFLSYRTDNGAVVKPRSVHVTGMSPESVR